MIICIIIINTGQMDMVMVHAATMGDASTVAMMLSKGAKVDAREHGFTSLLVAAQYDHTEVCKLLLNTDKVNIEDTMSAGHTALNISAREGHVNIVALSKGARVDNQGFTPLLAAAKCGHTEVCKLLLETTNENVKEIEPGGFTPLLFAAQEGHADVCELLLAKGSDLEERLPDIQYTALHTAAINGHESLLQLLLSYNKAYVNSRSRTESTPLHCASQERYLASVVTLLQSGADPLQPDTFGNL